jgi:pyruvate/2-oxoglutarate dehydrogenase complex dihydrolipoamide acyltransferase (E2) component
MTPLLLSAAVILAAQDSGARNGEGSRGSIPEALLRPQKGEAPRYPVDTVIGLLGQGDAPREAYLFARQAAAALTAGNMNAQSLSGLNRPLRESYLSKLQVISPRSYRIGSGREEADGAVSFLVRFIGREQGITGELYVRLTEPPRQPEQTKPPAEGESPAPQETTAPEGTTAPQETAEAAPPPPARRVWVLEELILDDPRSREEENGDDKRRFDFPPYERFF